MGSVVTNKSYGMLGDLETALSSPTEYLFISAFYNVTQSKAWTSVMTAILIIMLLLGCVTNFATSSRQLWAFVRCLLFSPP